ncbi:YbaK/EbsC family protein [Peribacillus muralis]|uniref:YbaK/EbsC family protein n=1 Tax=Peribacillus muralis TaxID=264697 RepID=UPI003D02631E
MFFESDIMENASDSCKSHLQETVYESLIKLQIPFERVSTDEAISLEHCMEINQISDVEMVKTLFLCTSEKTAFHLFITTPDQPFKAKDLSNSLGISSISFAPSELMEQIPGMKIGAATVFGVLMDTENLVQVVFDKNVLSGEWYGCSDGTTTGS